jgi:G3E family GTPase
MFLSVNPKGSIVALNKTDLITADKLAKMQDYPSS